MPVSRRKSPEPKASRNAPWALAMWLASSMPTADSTSGMTGRLAVHAVEALGDLVGGLGLGQHHAEQARGAAEPGKVVGPERARGVVDPHPGLAAGGQPVHDVLAGGVLLRGVHGVFDVQDDGVRAGHGRLVEELGLHCIDQQPGSGDFGGDIALGRMSRQWWWKSCIYRIRPAPARATRSAPQGRPIRTKADCGPTVSPTAVRAIISGPPSR